jgi:uncharacterized protein YbaR (Trm112 family)
MITPELLKILCCPASKQTLTLADEATVARLNAQIANQQLTNKAGQLVTDKLDGGLVRTDGAVLYPIRQNIPVLLVDEGIPL